MNSENENKAIFKLLDEHVDLTIIHAKYSGNIANSI